MSTTSCRREEVALCQPDRTSPAGHTPQAAAPASGECMIISEQQFMRDHTMYSAISSWLFAIAGATNIGVLSVLSSKILSAAEQGKPLKEMLGNKVYNRIALGMMAFGGLCMVVSNWLESKKVVTEWQLGAGKLQRKANIAEKELMGTQSTADAPVSGNNAAAPSRHWVTSVQTKAPDTVEQMANRFRP